MGALSHILRRASPLRILAGFAVAVLIALWAVPRGVAADASDKGVVANLLSKALSSNASSVSIGAVDGALSSDVTIRDIVIADADGPWLKLDKAHLVWNRLALLQRRLDVDTLEIGRLEILRRPAPSKAPKADDGPILPELPLKVIIKAFHADRIALGEPLIGVNAELSASGKATLGPPSEGLDLTLAARRLDAKGDFDVRLAFVPSTSRLSVTTKFDEPAGGLVARLANLPGEPPVNLSVDGDGPLDAFAAKLDFAAGPDIGAKGELHLARQGAGRRLTTQLKSRIAGLLPPVAADVFAGETALDANLVLGDDGAVAIDALSFASATARLDVTGGIDKARRASVALHAKSLPGAPHIGAFDFDAKGEGPLDSLAFSADVRARESEFSLGRLGAFDASFHAAPSGRYSDPATLIALDGSAKASGLKLVDPAYDEAFGPTAELKFSGSATTDGVLRDAKLDWTTQRLNAAFAGEASAARLVGKATFAAPDLSPFGKLAGLALKGALAGHIDIDAAPSKRTGRAAIDAQIKNFATGKAAIDGFAGGALALTGAVRRLPDGGFGFDKLQLEGAHGVALVDGEVATDKATAHAEIDIPEAKALDERVSGKAQVTADLSGALAHLDARLLASLENGRLMGRSTPRLQVSADFHDLTGDINGQAKLDGTIDALAATGDLSFAQRPDGGLAIDTFALVVGSARIDGKLALQPDHTAQGHLGIVAPKLDDLSALALTKLSGALDAQADLSSADGRQNAALRARSAGLTAGGAEVVGLDVDLTAKDVLGAPRLSGRAEIARFGFGGETGTGLKLKATEGSEGSDVDLALKARGLAIAASGRLAAGQPQFRLASFSASGAGPAVKLLKPAMLAWGDGGLDIDSLALGIGAGRATLAGHVGADLDLKLMATALPLAAAELAKPGLGLAGTLDADAKVTGAPDALTGNWRVSVAGLSAPATRSAGLPAISAKASGALAGRTTSLDATLLVGKQGSLRIVGSAPLSADGALDVRATGKLDLALANSLLSGSGQSASGATEIDMTVKGPPAKPRANGSIVLRGGAFADETTGFKAGSIEATLRANGDTLDIASFRATTPNGGSLSASGQVRLDADAGFPGTLKLKGEHAQLASTPIIATTADLALDVSGALARSPKVGGRIDIVSMDIEIPGRLPSQAVPLANIRHIDPGPTARARLALAAKAKAAASTAPPFVAALNVRVSAPNRIFIRGRGVDAELSGDLTVTGTTKQPSTNGAFEMRRGTFSILGKTLDFTRGSATFHGDVIPELDMLAQTTTSDITANIAITGSAAKPTFTFSSTPMLAQDEILSRILFDKNSGSLGPVQALQLANAVSSLSGGPDEFERLRKSLGVDSLDIGSNSSGGATLGVKRNLGNRLSVGVTTGTKPEDNGVSMDFDLTKRLRLQGGVNGAGASTAGVGYQFEY